MINIPDSQVYSVARWQPQGYSFNELLFLSATDKYGNKLLLRNFDNPIEDYQKALKEGYKVRWSEIKRWLDSLDEEKHIVLVCWCPYSISTQEQIKHHNNFCCHTGLIGKMINRHRPDITVVLDEDRDKYLCKEWKPDRYITTQSLLKEPIQKTIFEVINNAK